MKISHPLSFQADTPVPSEKHAPLLKSFLPYPSQPIVLIQQVLVNSLQASLFLQVSPPSNSYRILSCSLLATLLIVLKTSSIPSFSPTLGWTFNAVCRSSCFLCILRCSTQKKTMLSENISPFLSSCNLSPSYHHHQSCILLFQAFNVCDYIAFSNFISAGNLCILGL